MAEIASEGRVGKQGGGEATVFDTSGFFQNVYNMQKDLYALQEKKKKEIEQQNATWNAFLEDMPDVWESDYEYVNKALNEYNDYIIDLKTQGLDPNALDPTIMRKIRELQNKVAKETSRAKDNEDYSVKATQVFNNDKTNAYNKNHATQWFKDYTDPSKTPEQRAKMRAESNPFKYNYTIDEFIDDTIPEEVYTDTGRVKTIYRDKDSHKAIIFDNITNTDIGRDIYETLRTSNETPEQFTERVAELGQKKYGIKKDVQPAPARGGGGGGKSGSSKKDKFVYGNSTWGELSVSSGKSTSGAQDVKKNVISIKRTSTNDDLPPINVDYYGTAIEFQPISFYLTDDKKVIVFGNQVEDGKIVDKVWIDYDANETRFNSQLNNMDMREQFRALNNQTVDTQTSGTSTGKTSKETPAQRAARIANGG